MNEEIPRGELVEDGITKHMDRRFLSSIDLAGQGVVTFTIDRIEKHALLKYQNGQSEKNALLVYFKETKRPLKLNATNIKSIITVTETNKAKEWSGKKIKLHAEPGMYFGKKGLAVRVIV